MSGNFNPHDMGFNTYSRNKKREKQVIKNIDQWEKCLNSRYISNDFDAVKPFLANDYHWQSSFDVNYSLADNKPTSDNKMMLVASSLRAAISNLKITHHMFGEGNMVGNYMIFEGVHDGSYFDILPTNRFVCFFGVSLARFNSSGLIVEEKELLDECHLLKQINYFPKNLSSVTGLFPEVEAGQEMLDGSPPMAPEFSQLLFDDSDFDVSERDPQIALNIANWRGFTKRKYMPQGDDYHNRMSEVMAPEYKIRGFGGFEMNNQISEEVEPVLKSFEEFAKKFPDVKYESRLFGEGDMVLYHVAYQFTHSNELFGVPSTGRTIRSVNISIGRFDQSGRIVEESELHDILSQYKQVGIIQNSDKNDSLLSAYRSLNGNV